VDWDAPISQWFCVSTEPRSGGMPTKIGAVPKDANGHFTMQDIMKLNSLLQECFAMASAKGLNPRKPPHVDLSNMYDVVKTYSLGFERDDGAAFNANDLFTPAWAGPIHLQRRSRHSDESRGGTDKTKKVCQEVAALQLSRLTTYRWYNDLTCYPGRWVDSVIINNIFHVWKQYWRFGDLLYINSAESDPSLNEIRKIPGCYKYGLFPLFLKSHWTILFIDFVNKVIRYLNSQVLDPSVPRFQVEPFRKAFPDFRIQADPLAQQADNNSCGIYAMCFGMIYLFYEDKLMSSLTQQQVDDFRKLILHQIHCHFVLLNRP
jgi:Ulp1 protease family, C-terminal catalytic domain